MELGFFGAAHEVTGSCHMIKVDGIHILVDCGMEQGPDLYENQSLLVEPEDIDIILLTHAHIDHSGLIPLMYRNGFRGKIYTTNATYDLVSIMLLDSAGIQEFEASWRNRKAKRSGLPEYKPLYETNDALGVLELFTALSYNKKTSIHKGVSIRFTDVGHLLGSASIELWLTEGEEKRKIVFSGDIGNTNQPILKDPAYTKEADYVVVESTYGNRVHSEVRPDYKKELTRIFLDTFKRGGNVIIPSFAVGRTQELLYIIREIKEEKLLKDFNDFKVYVDSPLAIEATNLFTKNTHTCFDDEAQKIVKEGRNPLSFPGLITTVTTEESREINYDTEPKVIISASGMCEAGRIRHHLKHNLWREESTILFVGYQAKGTLGRKIIDGESFVKLFGEVVNVEAGIEILHGISGHADMKGLMDWLRGFKKISKKVIVVHGEDEVTDFFANKIENELKISAFAPYSGEKIDLISGEITVKAGVKKKKRVYEKATGARSRMVFERVLSSVRRLSKVVLKNEGLSNKELAKLESQINNLADRWDIR